MTQIAAAQSEQDPAGPMPDEEARKLVAAFLLQNRDQIRAMARGHLSPATRTVYDSEDVFSSVLRRIDDLASRGVLRASSERELWGLVRMIARNTALKKTLLIERTRAQLNEDPEYARLFLARLNVCRDDDEATLLIYRLMLALEDPIDRQVFALNLRGANHAVIGSLLGMKPEASRQRWARVRADLRWRFSKQMFD